MFVIYFATHFILLLKKALLGDVLKLLNNVISAC